MLSLMVKVGNPKTPVTAQWALFVLDVIFLMTGFWVNVFDRPKEEFPLAGNEAVNMGIKVYTLAVCTAAAFLAYKGKLFPQDAGYEAAIIDEQRKRLADRIARKQIQDEMQKRLDSLGKPPRSGWLS